MPCPRQLQDPAVLECQRDAMCVCSTAAVSVAMGERVAVRREVSGVKGAAGVPEPAPAAMAVGMLCWEMLMEWVSMRSAGLMDCRRWCREGGRHAGFEEGCGRYRWTNCLVVHTAIR